MHAVNKDGKSVMQKRRYTMKSALSNSPDAITKTKLIKFCQNKGLRPPLNLINKYISDSPNRPP